MGKLNIAESHTMVFTQNSGSL